MPTKNHDSAILSAAAKTDAGDSMPWHGFITGRKQSEPALQSSETVFRELVENMNSAVAVYAAVDNGEDFILRDFNRSGELMENIKREQLIGKRSTEAFPGAKEFGLLAALRRVWETGQPEHYPLTFYNDELIAGWRENYIFRLPSGEVVDIYNDVTERKKSEAALRVAAAVFETHDPIMITDASANIIRVNQAFSNITGFSPEEVLGKNPRVLSSGRHDKTFYAEMWQQLVRTGSWAGEIWDKCKNGKIDPRWMTITAVKNERQETIRYVAISSDITRRKRAGEILRESEFESSEIELRLEESELQYRTLADSGQALIWMADTERLCGYFNKVWLDFTGRALEQELGNGWAEGIHPDDLQRCLDVYASSYDRREKFSMDYRLRRHDGEYRWMQNEGCPRYDNQGEFSGYIAYCRDITGRKRTEQLLHELSAHLLTVREEEKASVAREIHDDLGSTLTALQMDACWLADELSANREATPLLKRVESMSGLLDNALKALRRIITDLRPAILDDLGLPEALKWQSAQFHKRTGIECRVVCPGEEGYEDELDGTLSINLFRIFQEALTNVARHSGASKVEVEFRRDGGEVALSVADNGRGLPEGHTVAPTSYGIRGMCERIVQMGGKIKFDSPPGGGFSMAVSLPLPADNKKKGAA